MAARSGKAELRRIYEQVVNKGKVDLIDELMSANFIEHEQLPPGVPPGIEGVKALFSEMRKAFPDLQATVHDMLEQGNKVVARVTFSGTHKGEFMGIPPTNRKVSFQAIDIVRYARGKAVEHWGVADNAGLFQQLGVAPPGQPTQR